MKLLFGNSRGVVELENLEENINLVQSYRESMGYRFYFDIYDDSVDENREKTQDMKYTNLIVTSQSRLKDFYSLY